MMNLAVDSQPGSWNRTRHVIILMTDGQQGPFPFPLGRPHGPVRCPPGAVSFPVASPSCLRPLHLPLWCSTLRAPFLP